MNKAAVVNIILSAHHLKKPVVDNATAFAPSNIALIKYWGKRDEELNLPYTSSLSISLGKKGTVTSLTNSQDLTDYIYLNKTLIPHHHPAAQRIIQFLNLFRLPSQQYWCIHTETNLPIAAGLASSASGFAALTLALNQWFGWDLSLQKLSILARLGSGSACRSLWHGFVKWHPGEMEEGIDSYAELLPVQWPELRIGLLIINTNTKAISSREAMRHTVNTSSLYNSWPLQVKDDFLPMEHAIQHKNFTLLGETAEANALAMHATMLSARPAILYSQPETIQLMQRVWQLRQQGIAVYFTQDAGPNLKLLFLETDLPAIANAFPEIEVIAPFESFSSVSIKEDT